MDESGFRAWLLGEGRESAVKESGAGHRVERLRKLEGKLAELGVSFTSLDLAYDTDRLASVIAAVAELQTDFKAGGEKYRILMPQSEAPKNRLADMKRFVGQYRDYRDGGSTGVTGADKLIGRSRKAPSLFRFRQPQPPKRSPLRLGRAEGLVC